jgi:hypothetical protein
MVVDTLPVILSIDARPVTFDQYEINGVGNLSQDQSGLGLAI